MSTLPGRARAVVIGAGIVGNSVAYHLHQQGWTRPRPARQGPVPEPGRLDRPRVQLHLPGRPLEGDDRAHRRQRAPVHGARRVHAERRHRGRPHRGAHAGAAPAHVLGARRGGSSGVSLVTPAQIKEMVPFLDESILVGGFHTEGVGVVDSLRAGTLMRERAQAAGALTIQANTEVLGIDVEHGVVRRVRTTRGDIEAEIVIIACGVWSPKLARMAGASIPLTPAVHQMIDVGPVPRFADCEVAHRVPDRARHGHEHVRAPGRRRASRSAPTPTGRSCTTPRRSPRSRRRRSRRPSSRSRRPTSSSRWSTRSSSAPRSSATSRWA